MKKLSIFITTVLALGAFSSCCADKDPQYHRPTEGSLVLNVPVMQDQYIELTAGNTLELVTSQPDYGYSAIAQYSAQMSLTEDFTKFYDLSPINATLARMSYKQEDIAQGFCVLSGISGETAEDTWNKMYPDGAPYDKIYFRAVCQLEGVNGSLITSNVVNYNYIKPYFAVSSPGYIYLVGSPEGWAGPDEGNADHYAAWRLFEPEDAIGSKVYSGKFNIPENPMFRFYTALNGWDENSYGTQVDDSPIQFPDFNGTSTFAHELVKGKGSFQFPNWPGGEMTIIVDMSDESNMNVTIGSGELEVFVPKFIYLIGNIAANWTEPKADNESTLAPYKLATTSSDPDVYVGKYEVEAGNIKVRFAFELLGWDGGGQWGYQEDDVDTTFELVNNEISTPYVEGKGNWTFDVPTDGTLEIAVNSTSETVTFTFIPGE